MTIDLLKDPACAKCKYAQLRQNRNNVLQSVYVCTRPNSERVKQIKSPLLVNAIMFSEELEKAIGENERSKFFEAGFELEHQLNKIHDLIRRMRAQNERGWTDPEIGYMLDCAFMEPKEEPKRPVYYPPSWKEKKKHENPGNGTADGSREVRTDEG